MIFSPIAGTPLVTQGFGQNPTDYAAYDMQGHNGIDFADSAQEYLSMTFTDAQYLKRTVA